MTHDKPLDIAVGTSRKTKTWKDKTMLWSELLLRGDGYATDFYMKD